MIFSDFVALELPRGGVYVCTAGTTVRANVTFSEDVLEQIDRMLKQMALPAQDF